MVTVPLTAAEVRSGPSQTTDMQVPETQISHDIMFSAH